MRTERREGLKREIFQCMVASSGIYLCVCLLPRNDHEVIIDDRHSSRCAAEPAERDNRPFSHGILYNSTYYARVPCFELSSLSTPRRSWWSTPGQRCRRLDDHVRAKCDLFV